MTREEALYKFFNSIDDNLPAYPDTNIPDTVPLPYLTYSLSDGLANEVVSITVQMWFKTDSEAVPNTYVRKIKELIGLGGRNIPYDNNCVWITTGTPFSISTNAENDKSIKVRQINLNLVNAN